MNLKSLSSENLLCETKSLVAKERELTLSILHHLKEIEQRRLYAREGFPSLFEYCLKELGYSEGAASRRIQAMRLLRDLPEIEKPIEEGKLNLTTVSQVGYFLRREEKQYSKEEKLSLLHSLENASKREVEKKLATLSPLPVKENVRTISATQTQVSLVISDELMAKLNRIKELMAHENPNPNYAELIEKLADGYLEKKDPLRPRKTGPSSSVDAPGELPANSPQLTAASRGIRHQSRVTTSPAKRKFDEEEKDLSDQKWTRYIPKKTKALIWQRDQGRCNYVSPSGKACESRFGLQIDHIKPFMKGGSSKDPENLRLLCQAHNQWLAVQEYGEGKLKS